MRGLGLISCCEDSQNFISFMPLDWAYFFAYPAEIELWCSLGRKGPRDCRHRSPPQHIPPGDSRQGFGGRFAFVCPFESTSLASLPSGGEGRVLSLPCSHFIHLIQVISVMIPKIQLIFSANSECP